MSEKKVTEDQTRMADLEDQVKRSCKWEIMQEIYEKICNLRKLIKKRKADKRKMNDVKDCLDDECVIYPYSKQIGEGTIRKEYALSHFMGMSKSV